MNNTEPEYSKILNLNNVVCDPDHIKPIFFKTYYPTKVEKYNDKELQNYRYIKGLKFIDQPEFVKNSEENNKFKNFFDNNYQNYLDTLTDFVNHQEYPFVLCSIPSSTAGKINMVTKIIKDVVKNDPLTFIDGSGLMQRTFSKETAHESSKNRSFEKDLQGLTRTDNTNMADKKIIVIDDVVTSGSSFTAAYKFLTGFSDINPEQLIFFAYGKTIKNIFLQPQIKKFDTFIFDIDQTLVNSQANFDIISAQNEYNSVRLNKNSTPDEKSDATSNLNSVIKQNTPSFLFKGIEELFNEILQTNSKIFFITNNNSFVPTLYLEKLSHKLFGTDLPLGDQLNFELSNNELHLNDNPAMQKIGDLKVKLVHGHQYLNCNFTNLLTSGDCKKEFNNSIYSMLKPSPEPIMKLIHNNNLNPGTTIGIGNTLGDIISYKAAGITAALAEWGNRGATTEIMEKLADFCLKFPMELSNMILKTSIPSNDSSSDPFPFA